MKLNGNEIDAEWVIGYAKRDKAKRIKALASEGLGYYIRREEGKGDSYAVEYAVRRAIDSPRPEHLHLATLDQHIALEKLRIKSQGLQNS